MGSSSASPPQMHAELQEQDGKESAQFMRSPENIHPLPPPRLLQNQNAQPVEESLIFGYSRAWYTYPPYTQHLCRSTIGSQFGDHLVQVPFAPSMMPFHGAVKHEHNTISVFNTGYPEINYASHMYDSSIHVSTILSQYHNSDGLSRISRFLLLIPTSI